MLLAGAPGLRSEFGRSNVPACSLHGPQTTPSLVNPDQVSDDHQPGSTLHRDQGGDVMNGVDMLDQRPDWGRLHQAKFCHN